MDTDFREHKSFPKPDRSNHQPQQNAKRDYFPEIDIGFDEGIMDDNRPYRIENWFDRELGLICRTVFYSILDIKNWKAEQHLEYIERNNLLEGQADKYKGSGLGFKIIEDNSGNPIWSVTAVMDDDDDY
jgi:hypothetical protein